MIYGASNEGHRLSNRTSFTFSPDTVAELKEAGAPRLNRIADSVINAIYSELVDLIIGNATGN